MAKKKTEQKQTQTQSQNTAFNNASNVENRYGWEQTPDSPDIEAFRGWRPQADPSIAYQAQTSRNRLNSSFINPLGANYSPVMEDQIRRAGNREIDQTESQAHRAGAYDVGQQRSGQLGALAALTSPRLVQTGSSGTSSGTGSSAGTASGTSSTVQGNNLFGDILQVAQAGAGMAAM